MLTIASGISGFKCVSDTIQTSMSLLFKSASSATAAQTLFLVFSQSACLKFTESQKVLFRIRNKSSRMTLTLKAVVWPWIRLHVHTNAYVQTGVLFT